MSSFVPTNMQSPNDFFPCNPPDIQSCPFLSSTVGSLISISIYLFYLLIYCRVVSEAEMKIKQLKVIQCCHKNSFPVTLEEDLDLCLRKLIIQQSIYLSLSSSIPTLRGMFNPVVKLKNHIRTASISHYDAFNLI